MEKGREEKDDRRPIEVDTSLDFPAQVFVKKRPGPREVDMLRYIAGRRRSSCQPMSIARAWSLVVKID